VPADWNPRGAQGMETTSGAVPRSGRASANAHCRPRPAARRRRGRPPRPRALDSASRPPGTVAFHRRSVAGSSGGRAAAARNDTEWGRGATGGSLPVPGRPSRVEHEKSAVGHVRVAHRPFSTESVSNGRSAARGDPARRGPKADHRQNEAGVRRLPPQVGAVASHTWPSPRHRRPPDEPPQVRVGPTVERAAKTSCETCSLQPRTRRVRLGDDDRPAFLQPLGP
jgi:hypothetical protein